MDHTIVHFEIPADDIEKMKKFYEELFGWKIIRVTMPTEYWLVQTVPTDDKGMPLKPGVNGGMFKRPPEQKTMKPVNYITVESIDEYLIKTENLGGKILVPKQQVPTVGWIAVISDPEGNQVGLPQPEMPT
jgi:predicted enzyme related to lactoylglutathione lyase